MKRGNCSICEKRDKECDDKQIIECLRLADCDRCNSKHYHYPYGKGERRQCVKCGAEWPVYK
jgi:hypothetical protein